jgi:hypothetical protein
MSTFRIHVAGSLLLLAGACSDDSGAGIAMSALSKDGKAPVAKDGTSSAFTMQQGLLHLRHIELDLPSGRSCSDLAGQLSGATCRDGAGGEEAKVRVEGPIVVDLVAGTSTPSLANVVIPSGTYRRIDLRVDDGQPQQGVVQAGSPLDRNALAVIAAFDHRGTPAVLDLRLNFDEDIRIEQPAGVSVAAGEDLVARFAAANWLAGINLNACVDTLTATAGRYVIDDRNDGACAGIEDTVKRTMKQSGDLDRE